LIVGLLGWNIAQQRELASLRNDVASLEKRVFDSKNQQLQAIGGLAQAMSQPPTVAAATPRPVRAKAKADGTARAGKARTGARTGTARADGPRTKAKAAQRPAE
jgi:hypothetical protein